MAFRLDELATALHELEAQEVRAAQLAALQAKYSATSETAECFCITVNTGTTRLCVTLDVPAAYPAEAALIMAVGASWMPRTRRNAIATAFNRKACTVPRVNLVEMVDFLLTLLLCRQ